MKFFPIFLFFLASVSAHATGSFHCSGPSEEGKKIGVSGCVPHSIPGLCSQLTLTLNGQTVGEIPRIQVPSFYTSGNFTGLIGMDEQMLETLVKLEYFGESSKSNILTMTLNGRNHRTTEVSCEFE